METRLKLKEILPADLLSAGNGIGDFVWKIPEWAFRPDEWTWAFLRGLKGLELTTERVWEVGVGTGINIAFLGKWFPGTELRYSDWNPQATLLARSNLQPLSLEVRMQPLLGQWDLLSHPAQRSRRADVIVGCLPQVPLPEGASLSEKDNVAHYYEPRRHYSKRFNALGLGLNHGLLRQARRVLSPGGQVVLNLGGRPGIKRLRQLFAASGFRPRVLHQETIPQDPSTSLVRLAEMERGGSKFEFFANPDGTAPLSAAQAEARRVAGAPVFHKIYVIAGTMP